MQLVPDARESVRVVLGVEALHPPLTGIGRYALSLARGLRRHPGVGTACYYAHGRWISDPAALLNPRRPLNILRRHVPLRPIARRIFHGVNSAIAKTRLQGFRDWVFHAPSFLAPDFTAHVVCTVHDLSHLRMPECHPRDRVEHLLRELPRTLERAAHVIAVSSYVRDELIAEFGLAPDRVSAVHHGVDRSFHPREAASVDAVLDRFGLQRGRYVLAVATLEPRKNLERLLEAHGRLPAALRRAYPLVLVGGRGWQNEALMRKIEHVRSEGEVCWPGYVAETDLFFLYAGAAGFAYPSLYEGFGLPVLEAMASGVPVLTSDRTALPEIAGGAALLVDPESVADIARGLERLLGDGAWRERAATLGTERARAFTWEACIDNTVEIYRKAARA